MSLSYIDDFDIPTDRILHFYYASDFGGLEQACQTCGPLQAYLWPAQRIL